MMEEALRQSLILSSGSLAIFVARPISAGFILSSALLLLVPLLRPLLGRGPRRP